MSYSRTGTREFRFGHSEKAAATAGVKSVRGSLGATLMVAFVVLCNFSAVLFAQDDTARAYVFTQTSPSGFVDQASERRTETVALVVDRIKKKYNRSISLVESKDQADVVIEILDVPDADGETWNRPNVFVSGSTSKKKIEFRVMAQLSVADYSTPITTQDKKMSVAARLVADDLEKWVKANRDRVLARRK